MKIEKVSTIVKYNLEVDESELLRLYVLFKDKINTGEPVTSVDTYMFDKLKVIFEEPVPTLSEKMATYKSMGISERQAKKFESECVTRVNIHDGKSFSPTDNEYIQR